MANRKNRTATNNQATKSVQQTKVVEITKEEAEKILPAVDETTEVAANENVAEEVEEPKKKSKVLGVVKNVGIALGLVAAGAGAAVLAGAIIAKSSGDDDFDDDLDVVVDIDIDEEEEDDFSDLDELEAED